MTSATGPRAAPRGVAALAGLGVLLLVAPLFGLLVEAPWRQIPALLGDPAVGRSLRVSLVVSTASAALSVALGVPVAWVLARTDLPGRGVLRALCVVPMVLPPVVGGVALLLVFGRRGLVGRVLDAVFGVSLPFTTAGAVLAATFVAMPFLIVTVEAGLRAADRRFEEVASTLGASRWTVLRRVTLPLAAPSLLAGTALAWARALGEFGATITFAGNFPGRTQTMPLAVFLELQADPPVAVLLSLLLLAVSVVVLAALRGPLLGRP